MLGSLFSVGAFGGDLLSSSLLSLGNWINISFPISTPMFLEHYSQDFPRLVLVTFSWAST